MNLNFAQLAPVAQNGFHPAPFVAGIGTLALVNAALAQLGGKSPFMWFLASLLLGPLVTIYLIISFKGK
jgi:hypothetical protein